MKTLLVFLLFACPLIADGGYDSDISCTAGVDPVICKAADANLLGIPFMMSKRLLIVTPNEYQQRLDSITREVASSIGVKADDPRVALTKSEPLVLVGGNPIVISSEAFQERDYYIVTADGTPMLSLRTLSSPRLIDANSISRLQAYLHGYAVGGIR